MQLEAFRHEADGVCVTAPVLDLVAYFDGPIAEAAAGVLAALNEFRVSYGSALGWWRGTDMKRLRRADARLWETVETAFAEDLEDADIEILATSGPGSRDAGGPACEATYYADEECGALRLALPASGDAKMDASVLLQLAKEAFGGLPLHWGYAGYSVHWNPVDVIIADKAPEIAGPWLLRYPGLAYGDPSGFIYAAKEGLLYVNWLTILGKKLAAKMGKLDVLRARLPAEVSIERLGRSNLLLRAGDAPDTGDVNRKQFVPLYGEVGRTLKKLRPDRDVLENVSIEGLAEEQQESWLDRFFK